MNSFNKHLLRAPCKDGKNCSPPKIKNSKRNLIVGSSHLPNLSMHFLMPLSLSFFPQKYAYELASIRREEILIFCLLHIGSNVPCHMVCHWRVCKVRCSWWLAKYPLSPNGRHYHMKLRTWSCGQHPRHFRNNCLASGVGEKPNLQG